LSTENNFYDRIENLSKGTYQVAIAVNGQNYERIYSVTVGEPDPLVASTRLQLDTRSLDLNLAGASSYTVQLNNRRFDTTQRNLTLNLSPGMNHLTVYTGLDCQGTYEEEFFVSEKVQIYPNPTNGPLNIYVGGSDSEVDIQVRTLSGSEVYLNKYLIDYRRMVALNLSDLPDGLYLITVTGSTVNSTHKIVKN